jgi:hypothetical protein
VLWVAAGMDMVRAFTERQGTGEARGLLGHCC